MLLICHIAFCNTNTKIKVLINFVYLFKKIRAAIFHEFRELKTRFPLVITKNPCTTNTYSEFA